MELTVVIIMLAVGVGLAASIIITFAAAQREAEMSGATRANVAPDRNHIAASLLFNLLLAGGTPPDAALVALAGTRSKHNTYLSVPLVWMMIDSHTTSFALDDVA